VAKGYPVSCGLGSGGLSSDFADMVADADFATARTCDAVIDDLPHGHQKILEIEYVLRQATASDILRVAQQLFWAKAKKWLI
jgi:hypothetical protein